MIFSYIKTAFRNLRKYKGYSFINIVGLAVGIACCILILMWVRDEMSYDGFHVKADRLFRAVEQQTYRGGELFPVAVTPASTWRSVSSSQASKATSITIAHPLATQVAAASAAST